MPGAKIGRNCTLGQNLFIGRDVTIGNGVKIQNNVSVYQGVELEDDVFCGPSVVFTNVKNPRSTIDRRGDYRKTLVRHGATLGANCTVICGVTIGRFAFLAAGAVVTKDVPDYALVAGVPARLVGWSCQCGAKLEFNDGRADCFECGRSFLRDRDNQVEQMVKAELRGTR
jgi:UDP-2-acetamido-3-amino-2,3-dideoxy-glucuronate N-acetyltransferase